MNIQFQLKMTDILALQEDVIISSYTHQMKSKYFKWIIAIIILLAGVWMWRITMVLGIVSILAAVIFWLMASKLYTKMAEASLKKKVSKKDYSVLLKPCKMEFSEVGINRILGGKETAFSWETFTRHSEDNNHFFLYVDDLQGLIIPKNPKVIDNGNIESYQMQLKNYVEKLGRKI